MFDEIYKVERDDYAGFLGQIKSNAILTETVEEKDCHIINVSSLKYGTHLCSRVIPNDEEKEEEYYIFNYPDADDRRKPKPILKIKLNTQEEVQAFVDAIEKIQNHKK